MLGTQQSLTEFNTLGLAQRCRRFRRLCCDESILEFCQDVNNEKEALLVLGGGSNLVFTEDFNGVVIKIESTGITLTEDDDDYFLNIAAGESWPQLVESMVSKGINGLENLALIPGTVGAAPIQNIGAYGVEFEQVCDWVEFFNLETKTLHRLSAQDCQFSYRDSIFKKDLKNKTVILRVGLKLSKQWQPVLSYGPLKNLNSKTVTSKAIFNRVCEIRQSKLPDPSVIGNVGSFFKNPIVSNNDFQKLISQFPQLVSYPNDNGIKLAAGWLIDHAGLKGHTIGKVGVHDSQALVLVNHGGATGKEIIQLASFIAERILTVFGVKLEVEPRLIGKNGEIEFYG
ncbi:UDP-N-acetylmuramate dehydrogenase [Parashewanella spongiae]|uniref:UDP-N-acetylenolpyruvoylglucosamine reductase n=1 Tax=Parashewanella spongiae TaxID=342950 RepID=A0A3A6TD91_9GAMM|nr:UDP-N-acetylmuramate dehydrogenase [Parashewanella spongiae]MCL1080004.1 UDP-N-acetylmuramate dehydrogenase [Parashewanella spongiae]RJY05999.1 UDP-N-acetylmuramate dehydrogenase [Parashewanella spongiae]